MKEKNRDLKLKQWIDAPLAQVYEAFTSATALTEWLCDVAQADAHPGGRLYLWWNNGYYASGEFVELEQNESILFTWHGRQEPGATHVQVTLKSEQSGTQLTLAHLEIGPGKVWSEPRRQFSRGWRQGLENLKSVLETGCDLRLVRRPALGVTALEEVTPAMAKQLGMPLKAGVRLLGLIQGAGAQAAGLQQEDILVKAAGRKVATPDDLRGVLDTLRAGDTVKVTYFRHGERQKAKIVLSQRPVAEIPASIDDLAALVRQNQLAMAKDLDEICNEIGERQADFRPTPQAWNAREILAHLIAAERETHAWIVGLIEGQSYEIGSRARLPARLAAMIAASPTLEALRSELKRNQAETVTLVESLPPEFVARKGSYWRMGQLLLQMPAHFQSHMAQIRANLEAAKAS
jgi:uncharacterized protein YndB with AHSA1/START domain